MPGERKRAKKVGLRFSETMSGYLAEGAEGFEEGEKTGQEQDSRLSFDVTIEIESVSKSRSSCSCIPHWILRPTQIPNWLNT